MSKCLLHNYKQKLYWVVNNMAKYDIMVSYRNAPMDVGFAEPENSDDYFIFRKSNLNS